MRNILIPCLALLVTLTLSSHATGQEVLSFDQPQIKINTIYTKKAPTITLLVSFLDQEMEPVTLKPITDLTVKAHASLKDKKGEPLIKFVDGKPEDKDKEKTATFDLFPTAEIPMDVILVLPGYSDPMMDETLWQQQSAAVNSIFKKLPEGSNINFIWYSDRLYSYIPTKGKTSEMSLLDENLDFCLEKRIEAYEFWGEEAPVEEGEEPVGPPTVCGLVPLDKKIGDIVAGGIHRGYFPQLFGILSKGDSWGEYTDPETGEKKTAGVGLCGASSAAHEPQFPKPDEAYDAMVEAGTAPMAALDEAIRYLLLYGRPDSLKVILLLSDGHDGYVGSRADCKIYGTTECEKQHGSKGSKKGKKSKKVRDCVKALLDANVSNQQNKFRPKLLKQLALLNAANITVHSVGYPTGQPDELDRLKYLAFQTGGTFRTAAETDEVVGVVEAVLKEIGNQYAVTFAPEETEGKGEYFYSVEVVAKKKEFATSPYLWIMPELPGGPVHMVKQLNEWLIEKVGTPWNYVILAVIAIIILILVMFVLAKIIGKLKGGAKAAKGAAKKAGKAPGGKDLAKRYMRK